ncbi:hypothetical protein KAW64_17550, partial [bacterium]|nr:hypothetical protein [bacterium]
FIILGDMNIENEDELLDSAPAGFVSMNSECWPTNTNPNSPMPYDHVMYRPEYTSDEIDEGYGMWIVDLLASMEATWDTDSLGPYPGDTLNYSVSEFREYYSDHNPIEFRMASTGDDD